MPRNTAIQLTDSIDPANTPAQPVATVAPQPAALVATPAGDVIEPSLDDVNDLSPEDDEDDEPSRASVDIAQLATAIVGAVNTAQGPRKIKSAEYMRTRSEHRDKAPMVRKIYQNGVLLSRRQLTKEAIAMLNVIRPGICCGDLIKIVEYRDGDALGNAKSYDITYPNKTFDDRMAFKARFQDFEGLLRAILREQGVSPLAA